MWFFAARGEFHLMAKLTSIMRSHIAALLLLLCSSFAFTANGKIVDIRSAKGHPQAFIAGSYKMQDRSPMFDGEEIGENCFLQVGFDTNVTYTVEQSLELNINPKTVLSIVYVNVDSSSFKAMYELISGKIDVDFDSSVYEDDELIIKTPFNNTETIAVGTKFTIDSKGFVRVDKGIVKIRRLDDNNYIRAEKILRAGEFGSFNTETIKTTVAHHNDNGSHNVRAREPFAEHNDGPRREPAQHRDPMNTDRNKAPGNNRGKE